MFRCGYFTVFLLSLLITACAGAVTTPRDLRAAFQDLADVSAGASAESPLPHEVLDRTVRLRLRLRDYGIGSVIDGARRASKAEDVLQLAQQRLREAEFPLLPAGKAVGETQPKARLELFLLPGAPDWVGLKAEISLACGSDHALYFLRLQPAAEGGFEAILAFAKENTLESVADLAVNFGVAGIPLDQGASIRIATIESAGGCASLWRPVRMRVYQTDQHPYRPLRLFEKERLAFLGEEPLPRASAPDGIFVFDYRALFWLDTGRHSRRETVRLAQLEQGVRLLPPASENPIEFLDEWVTTPWSEAQRWAGSSGLTTIREWHEELAGSHESRLQTTLVSSGECPDSREIWVHLKAGDNAEHMRSVYGLLRAQSEGYRVERFSPDLPSGCRSEAAPARP
ncbi:MAG: hypothetical protein U5J83_08470 [Bryobacterales bacterium]|nr:hypothetical protein [Bryobacterales bacterium]